MGKVESFYFIGTVSVSDVEKLLEMDSGDSCTTMYILNATELCT